MSCSSHPNSPANDAPEHFDAVVIGAGFGGLRLLYELRGLGLRVRVIEAGSEVGGTWFWNRYPGARTDSESWVYAYSFSKDLQDEWEWTERFPPQAETLAYLSYVAGRFNMRPHIEFDTRATSATYDEESARWLIATDTGKTYSCRYFVPAAGLLSAPYVPDFPGLDSFEGRWYVTGRWPEEDIDFGGRRVAVIGTGATGIQITPILAHIAKQLYVFQRTPNYVLPARNYTLGREELRSIRANYDEIWRKARKHFFGFPWDYTGRTVDNVTPEEHQSILERGWELGGFKFIFDTLDDIFVDERSNRVAADFVRNKIRAMVKDPVTAELLCPKDYPLASKRPPLGHFYYETFNRDNVELVDVSANAISEVTSRGLRLTDGTEYEVDDIIFATGFDAVTGSYTGFDVRGKGGVTLAEKWADGPRSYLGIGVDDFPNMFMMCGPQSPFANIPVVIDGIADWIGRATARLEAEGGGSMEPTPESVAHWAQHVENLVNATVLPQGKRSWFLGANIPGKPQVVLFYFGGAGAYRDECDQVADNGFDGFVITSPAPTVSTSQS